MQFPCYGVSRERARGTQPATHFRPGIAPAPWLGKSKNRHKKRAAFGKRWRAVLRAQTHVEQVKTQNIRSILVPVDFSKMSTQAIEAAKRLAQSFGSTIHLAYVRQFYYPAGFTAPMPPVLPFGTVAYDQQAEKRVARELNALANKCGLSSATCHVLAGAPAFDEVCRLAQEIPADLIVMPAHGHTGLKHVFLGSTAERIVQHSPCPVFVARQNKWQSHKGAALAINTVLVPVDFSDCSLQGLKYALPFAGKFAAKIILLHVVDLSYAYTADRFAMYDLSTLEDAARKAAERQMREFARAVKLSGVKVETLISVGSTVAEICAFAERRDVDLIITSTHGLTGFKHVLIGSTAEHVVRHATCPVLVVPSHPNIRAAHLTRRLERGRKISGRTAWNGARKEKLIETVRFTRNFRKLTSHAFPERRKTNKFRESDLSR